MILVVRHEHEFGIQLGLQAKILLFDIGFYQFGQLIEATLANRDNTFPQYHRRNILLHNVQFLCRRGHDAMQMVTTSTPGKFGIIELICIANAFERHELLNTHHQTSGSAAGLSW